MTLRTISISLLVSMGGCQAAPVTTPKPPEQPVIVAVAPAPSPQPPASLPAPIVPPSPAPVSSPFVVVSPYQSSNSVFEMEDGLYAVAGDDIFELASGAQRSRFDLARGLPSDDCKGITGLVGRFPDAAFALVSWSSRACGSVFGAHAILRWSGRSWTPLAAPQTPVIKLEAHASLLHSQGPGVVICDNNAVGDGCGGHYTVLARVDRSTASPVGRRISTQLSGPMFRVDRSGLLVALGDAEGTLAIERWQPGSSKGSITRWPRKPCTPSGIHVFDARNIVVAASCEGDPKGLVMRFDGRTFATIPTPTGAPIVALTGELDGTIWMATADGDESSVHRRSPKGEWASARLPREASANAASKPFAPSRLVVRGEDVWAIGPGVLYARRGEVDGGR